MRWQAAAFIRTVWSSIDGGLVREPYPRGLEPTYYTIAEGGDPLLNMAATFTTSVTAAGRTWTAACLGNVFTFPAARHRGLGRAAVAAATSDIRDSEVDVAALLCDPELEPFYAGSGWAPTSGSQTLTADGRLLDSSRMMLFLSEPAAEARLELTTQPMYVSSPW